MVLEPLQGLSDAHAGGQHLMGLPQLRDDLLGRVGLPLHRAFHARPKWYDFSGLDRLEVAIPALLPAP